MSSNKPPPSLSTEAWEKLRALKEQAPPLAPSKKDQAPENTLPLETEEKANSTINTKKTWQDRRKEHETIIDWLCKTFPDTFNFKKPKPLKLNITYDIYAHLPSDGSISKLKLRAAIKYYTHSTFYLKALVEDSDRIDLQGLITEPVDPSHKEFTQTLLAERLEKKKALKAKKPFKKAVKNSAAQEY